MRFINAVHRRLVVIRAGETAGICLLVACALLAPLLMILWWNGEPAVPATLLGIISGLWLGVSIALTVRRWPSTMMAASEADRQFELADLLATAMVLDASYASGTSDLMSGEVLAVADARCRTLSPSQLVLRRLGSRTWGGVGLSLALVITLALVPTRPARLDAAETANDATAANALTTPTPASISSTTAPNRHPSRVDPANEDSTMMTSAEDNATGNQPTVAARSNSTHAAGSGGGESQSNRPAATPDLPTVAGQHDAKASGEAAGGSSRHGSNGGDNIRSGSATAHSRATPQWHGGESGTSPNDGSLAAPDRVPGEYRDLVRDYFQRD
ncbi:MAG TPA: hypothetical protein VLI90_12805 [Tepidisphaeraceae bacterium]|nr:hypothetical protein [Tepidisphaeraceae bacterium]